MQSCEIENHHPVIIVQIFDNLELGTGEEKKRRRENKE